MARNLKDMVVVITGASAGIGKSLAETLARRGAKLVLSARRLDRLHSLNQQIGGGHLCVAADVSRPEDCRKLIEASMNHFGRIDTLVCNSGFGIYKSVHGTPADEWREIFNTNVFGTTDCIIHTVPGMLKNDLRDGWRGQVMIVSSVVARRGVPYLGAYSATKAAQLMLAESMRVELSPQKIAVTTVHPIQTKTEFGQTAMDSSGVTMPPGPMRQRVEQVSAAMLSAIAQPRAEVWPHGLSRWLFGLGTLFPSFSDSQMANYRDKILAANPQLRR